MPKIIENVKEQLLAVAKRQISERGYAGTTIRSVAGECGLAVGTVYNYFKSKDMLIASFMLEDWVALVGGLAARPTDDQRELLSAIYDALRCFMDSHSVLFADAAARGAFMNELPTRHKQLRGQLAELVLPVCGGAENREFLAEFIAESLLTWTTGGKDFEEIYSVIKKII